MASKTTTASSSQSTAEKNPYAPAIPALGQIQTDAGKLYDARQGQQFFPGQTYAGFTPEQNQSFAGISQRATQGNAAMNAGQGLLNNTISGQYLSDGNPFSGQVAQATIDQLAPQINSVFSRAGRTGSDAHGYGLARGLAAGLAPTNAAQYDAERNRQMQAASMAPTYAANDYTDLAQLQNVGAQKQQMNQLGINDQMARYQFEQDKQARALQEYLGTTGTVASMGGTTNQSGTQTQTQSQQQSPIQTALGAGLMGASLFTSPVPSTSILGGLMKAAPTPAAYSPSPYYTTPQMQSMGGYF